MQIRIPFNRPYLDERETDAVLEALKSEVLRGDGPIGHRVQRTIQEWLGVRFVYFTTSCTHALELAMMTLDIGPGDEVIMPSFTFVSTANAVLQAGATPVFADIQPDTLNISVEDVAAKVTERTKLVVPVHYAGVGCDMDNLAELARQHDIRIVEDAAQGIGAWYKNRALGTIGDIGCLSFHDTKNIVCGEGGAFLTNDEELAYKAEIAREKGTNRSAFMRGEVDRYTWVSRGSSYIQSDLLAAVLEVQLHKRDEIWRKRKAVWEAYYDAFQPLAAEGVIQLPVIPTSCRSNYHIFFFLTTDQNRRAVVLSALQNNGIQATFHYVPLHSSPFGKKVHGSAASLPVTDRAAESLVRLPLYPQLEGDCTNVAHTVSRVVENALAVAATA